MFVNDVNNQDSEFLKERIKQRPLNRRKLIRRMLLTILMAVIFGTVASVTIILLEPIISERLYPEEEQPELIIFPEDFIEEEILPEDMIADEREMQEIQQALEAENNPQDVPIIDDDHIRQIASDLIENQKAGIDELISINNALLEISNEVRKSLVTVTGLTAEINLFNNPFENRVKTTGAIFFDEGRELLILANIVPILNSDTIILSFTDGKQYPAEIKRYDRETGLAILSVLKSVMDRTTLDTVKPIETGNSSAMSIIGTPVIAVGRIVGNADSTCYGYITSITDHPPVVDAKYRILFTDIYGSTNAAGIIVNLQGQVIGIVDTSNNTSDARNIVSAIGITELRRLIATMSNDRDKPYIGIYGVDVTSEAHEIQGVPRGAFIGEVSIDSPAMHAGLQSGDIITKMGGIDVLSFLSYVNILFDYRPEQVVTMTVMRQGPDGYRELEIEVVVG